MTSDYAVEIVGWRYPAPYDIYDMADGDPGFLTNPENGYFALTDETGLIGFRLFGADGQVPGGDYDDSALDTGGGLRPDLTGKGNGREAIRTGLEFGEQLFHPRAFRVTIATFNVRAQRVIAGLGFHQTGTFPAAADGRSFGIWVRPQAGPRDR